MSVQIRGNGGTSAEVGGTIHRALRVNDRPVEAIAWNSLGVPTGLLTTVVAQGAIFSLRNTSTNLILVRRINLGFVLTTAFTAAQRLEFGVRSVRNWTTADSGGTALSFASSNTDLKTALGVPNVEARIATTAALTAGTRTPDTNYQGIAGAWAAGVSTLLNNKLFDHNTGDYPIVLANNEGVLIDNLVLMGAAGVGIAYINIDFAEVATTEF